MALDDSLFNEPEIKRFFSMKNLWYGTFDFQHQLITGVLRWRANSSPEHVLYTLLNSKGAVARTLTCSELHKRAEKIAALLQERGKLNPGDHVGKNSRISFCRWPISPNLIFSSTCLPTWSRFNCRFLRLLIPRSCSSHHPTSTRSKLSHNTANRSNDCRRLEVFSYSLDSERHQTFEVEGSCYVCWR